MWCIPPKHSAAFVCHMEDVLEVYHRPHDPQRPVICLDECSKQLIGEVRTPLPPCPARDDRPGRAERYDCEYVRNGTANLFMAFEPLGGWREVAVTDLSTPLKSPHSYDNECASTRSKERAGLSQTLALTARQAW